MHVNWGTLAFAGESRFLERRFRDDLFLKFRSQLRFSILLSIFYLASWSYIDQVYYLDKASLFILLKFAIPIPVFVLGYLITYTRHYEPWFQGLNNLFVLTVSFTFNLMILYFDGPDVFPLLAGQIITLTFNYAFISSRFLHATACGWLVFLMTVGVSIYRYEDIGMPALVTITVFLVMFNMLGMAINYFLEYASRKEFFLTYQLQEAHREQLELNRELQQSLAEVEQLRGLLPVCAWCKQIRDDEGYWHEVDNYLEKKAHISITHSICPDCYEAEKQKQQSRA
ncbi:MAG: hypothetical protein C0622_10230 [Desulfuromonas sp.]|nr:MAG: hypothetical protein C0622_10230 [Desulfuromonas sp.]